MPRRLNLIAAGHLRGSEAPPPVAPSWRGGAGDWRSPDVRFMRPQVHSVAAWRRLAGTDGLKQQARLTACRENYAISCSGYRCIRIEFRDSCEGGESRCPRHRACRTSGVRDGRPLARVIKCHVIHFGTLVWRANLVRRSAGTLFPHCAFFK